MKKLYFLILALCFFIDLNAQNINIPDEVFKTKLLSADANNNVATDINNKSIKIDTNNNNEIELAEAVLVYHLNISFVSGYSLFINDFTGINSFTSLRELYIADTRANLLDITSLSNLELLHCSKTLLSILNVKGLKNLVTLKCYSNSLVEINLEGCVNLKALDISKNNDVKVLDVSSCKKLESLLCEENSIVSLDLNGLNNLTELNCNHNNISSINFGSASNILKLYCDYNQLETLDISNFKKITELTCQNNQLLSLDTTGLSNLSFLNCSSNKLISLDVTTLKSLTRFFCTNNELSTLRVTDLPKLHLIDCNDNKLSFLDLTDLIKLTSLSCNNNEIINLDFKSMNSVDNEFRLYCSNNKFSTLDLSSLKRISRLYCPNNPLLETINLKNGGKYPDNDTELDFSNNPNLNYICQDANEIYVVEGLIRDLGFKNCTVNSYCSFDPGGKLFTIDTNNKFDINNNGCDNLDIVFPNLNFKFTNGIDQDNYVYNTLGSCIISVPEGNYNITPILENPDYFTISPKNAQIAFPTQSSPYKQNFCVESKGSHSDLEVSALPVIPFVPGFETKFKIVFKNKGNRTQSGSINLNFDNAVLDYVSSNVVASSQIANDISWNFTNLNPFESREIVIVLKLNRPTDTPAVNLGDILKFTTSITSKEIDEDPVDNTFAFNQTVVGSMDPNNKTCLEGEIITSHLIGEYVHYMIRFENMGNYPAKNIVVKDFIDLSKFDISTLIPTSASHTFVTKISEGNKVEFIFENINLPFNDANNDGYIAFKIKTKPTLVVGDSFTNDANIYFDYNFPILTNKATSIFKNLGTQDFEFSKYFVLYPNPSSQILNISRNENITIQSFEIYDILGQLVIVVPNAKTNSNIDVSALRSGNYFITVKSDKGSSSMKFVKL